MYKVPVNVKISSYVPYYIRTVSSPYRRLIGGPKLAPIKKMPILNHSLEVLNAIWCVGNQW